MVEFRCAPSLSQAVGTPTRGGTNRTYSISTHPSSGRRLAIPGATSPTSVEDLAESYLAHARGILAPRTVELRRGQLRTHVVPTLGADTPADRVTPADIRRLINDLRRRRMSGSAVRGCVSATSAIFKHGMRDLEVIDRNPVEKLHHGELPSSRRQSEPRYLALTEVRQLFDNLTDDFRPIAATCYWAALRVSEALALTWENIDVVEHQLHVVGSKTLASTASLPLVSELEDQLRQHRSRQEHRGLAIDATSLVFQTRGGRSPGRRNVHRAVARAAVKAGLVPPGKEPVGVHDLRHSFAALAFDGGLSLTEVARLLRHASPNVTSRVYGGLSDPGIAALGQKLEMISQHSVER